MWQIYWLPHIIKTFQKGHPNIDYEWLLGDYTEIEERITAGRVDCGFLRLPTRSDLDTIFGDPDDLKAHTLPDHLSIFQKDALYAGRLLPPPKSWSSPVSRSSA